MKSTTAQSGFWALAFFLGFYLLIAVIVAALVGVPCFIAQYQKFWGLKLLIVGLLTAGGIIYAAWPRTSPRPGGIIPIDRSRHPRLFDLIDSVARSVGTHPPRRVFLTGDVNAGVYQQGGFWGIGGSREMVLGLPLLASVSVEELKGILAHEYGHFIGGETRLGGLIYVLRSSISRTIETLCKQKDSVLGHFFVWYGNLFLRKSNELSRRQEFAADALAARTVGEELCGAGLNAVRLASANWMSFVANYYAPALGNGLAPPLCRGFRQYMAGADATGFALDTLATVAAPTSASPYDTHPPFEERLLAWGLDPADAPFPEGGPRACEFLEDLAEVDGQVAMASFGSDRFKDLAVAPWSQVLDQIMTPRLEWECGIVAPHFVGMTPRDFGRILIDPKLMTRRFRIVTQDNPLAATAFMGNQFGRLGMGVARKRGGTLVSRLGHYSEVKDPNGRSFLPTKISRDLAFGAISLDEWDRGWGEAGLLDVDLGREWLGDAAPAAAPDKPLPEIAMPGKRVEGRRRANRQEQSEGRTRRLILRIGLGAAVVGVIAWAIFWTPPADPASPLPDLRARFEAAWMAPGTGELRPMLSRGGDRDLVQMVERALRRRDWTDLRPPLEFVRGDATPSHCVLEYESPDGALTVTLTRYLARWSITEIRFPPRK